MSHTVDIIADLLKASRITEAEAEEAIERRKGRPPPMSIPVNPPLLACAAMMCVDPLLAKSMPGG